MTISKRMSHYLVIGVMLITTMTATAQSPNSRPAMEGAWNVSIAFSQPGLPPCAPASTIAIATNPQGGTLIADSCFAFEGAGYGVWARKANNLFAVTFVGNSFAADGTVESSYKVNATLSVGPSGDTLSGTFQTTIFDLQGHVLETFTGTLTGVRIVVEP